MHGQFYQVLHARNSTPTDRERSLASGATELPRRLSPNTPRWASGLIRYQGDVRKQAAEARHVSRTQEYSGNKSDFQWLRFLAIVIHYIGNDGSSECLIDFRELVDHHFVMDNATNNDTMVEAFARKSRFGLPQTILNYVNENEDLAEYALAPSEWAALKQVSDWLKSYRYATTKMSATKQPMLSTTHAVFRWLQDELKAAIAALPSTADPALLEGLVAAHRKLSDYFTKFDESRYYSWATRLFFYISIKHILFLIPPSVLDPRLSYEALRKDYADDSELLAGLEKSKADLKKHFETHYADAQPSSVSDIPAESSPAGSPVKFNIFARYGARATSSVVSNNELEDYFRLTSIAEPFEDTDPLQWWYARRHKFPNLICSPECFVHPR
ncbi:hypothetical protein B0H13DRAFT_2172466 [Mycena leptocephala]|nr:hypothetical protein B0H13DRAFT_2172466 [Mycena leptocephala]